MGKLNLLGSILANSGVPKSVLKFAEDYTPVYANAPYFKNNENKQLPPTKQELFVQNSFDIMIDEPKRILMYSTDNVNCARAVALRMYIQFMDQKSPCIWHNPTDDFNYKQDDAIIALKTKPNIPLIVLDNLSTFMQAGKIEKVSRIVSKADCPVFLIISGKKPFTFCIERLGITPDFIIRAENNGKRYVASESKNKSENI
jgi:hypothetical protein